MEAISVGDVVFVRFPFSDLSASKKRPALVLACLDRNDLILCQITSKAYADLHAIKVKEEDFQQGALIKVSYVRPSKLFTANESILAKKVGTLNKDAHQSVVHKVIQLII